MRPRSNVEGMLEVEFGAAPAGELPDSETPFCIALLGDFSGRQSSGVLDGSDALANRRAILVDRDNFEEVLAQLHPELNLPGVSGGGSSSLKFRELDDFHPDRIIERAEMFRRLREARIRLNDPATFAGAAEELGLAQGNSKPGDPPPESPRVPVASPVSGSLLDAVIEEATIEVAPPRQSNAPAKHMPEDLRRFVKRVTEPELAASADPRQAEVLALIDRALSSQMRALLHTPDFQALEAAWRAVFLLVRRLETGTQLKLYLIDISKAELAEDLNKSGDLRSTGLSRLLVDRSVDTPGAEPWALIVGNYTFAPTREDAATLARIGLVASLAGAPFIAAASPKAAGCESFAETPYPEDWRWVGEADDATAWAGLRTLPESRYLGLAQPRFLLRLPYGAATDPVESFSLEEMPDTPEHEDYLWGNPAFACALLLAQSFSDSGWQMRPGEHSEINGLPLHTYKQNGDAELKPCAEALLTERAAGKILESGLMPLVWLKRQDTVRLLRFQSVAKPLRALAGRWQT